MKTKKVVKMTSDTKIRKFQVEQLEQRFEMGWGIKKAHVTIPVENHSIEVEIYQSR